jgi:transcriptional regulator with XRE-family HTH domain
MRRKYLFKRRKNEPTGKNSIRTVDPILQQIFLAIYHAGLPAAEIARRVGITNVSLTRYKKGTATPTIVVVNSLAQVLGYELQLVRKNDDRTDNQTGT